MYGIAVILRTFLVRLTTPYGSWFTFCHKFIRQMWLFFYPMIVLVRTPKIAPQTHLANGYQWTEDSDLVFVGGQNKIHARLKWTKMSCFNHWFSSAYCVWKAWLAKFVSCTIQPWFSLMVERPQPILSSRNQTRITPGAVVCSECELSGEVTIGANTIIHPKARILAEAGPIQIGAFNLIEEQVEIINRTPDSVLKIGDHNVFEVSFDLTPNCHQNIWSSTSSLPVILLNYSWMTDIAFELHSIVWSIGFITVNFHEPLANYASQMQNCIIQRSSITPLQSIVKLILSHQL